MINWKVRFANKNFWLSFIPAILIAAQAILDLIGIEFDFGDLGNKLRNVINAVFGALAILGVVNDPTTDGTSDSLRAMTYEVPYKDILEDE